MVGWFNTKLYDETKDEQNAQGWTALVLDTNGNGKRDAYVEPDQPIDPTKDKRISAPFYGVAPSPTDGSIWGSVTGLPGRRSFASRQARIRRRRRSRSIYELPMKDGRPVAAFSPRGMDVDRNGVVWTGTASGHLVSFDRRKCKASAQRSEGDRPALRRRLHRVSAAGTELPGLGRGQAAPTRRTTRSSIASTCSAPAATTCRW